MRLICKNLTKIEPFCRCAFPLLNASKPEKTLFSLKLHVFHLPFIQDVCMSLVHPKPRWQTTFFFKYISGNFMKINIPWSNHTRKLNLLSRRILMLSLHVVIQRTRNNTYRFDNIYDWSLLLVLGEVFPCCFWYKRPQFIYIYGRTPVLLSGQMEMTHSYFTKVTRMAVDK